MAVIEKFRKAKSYCDHPFKVKFQGKVKKLIPITATGRPHFDLVLPTIKLEIRPRFAEYFI